MRSPIDTLSGRLISRCIEALRADVPHSIALVQANIVEGSARQTTREWLNFLNMLLARRPRLPTL
jgi:hypothetical protein